eukprot:631398-Prorocentrum_lima.AAC.1
MTSSLVGSEMCIRDRCSRVAGSTLSTCLTTQISRASSGDARSIDANPVSYTHLTLPTICSV